MDSQTLRNQCQQAVEELAGTEQWPLPPAGIGVLVDAILPFLQSDAAVTSAEIQTIARNYQKDGPTVQQMCTPHSSQGERLWTAWREQLQKAAQKEGLSPEDAEDFVQQIFPEVRRALDKFKFKANLKTFFAAIFRRQFAKWLQTQKYQRIQAETLGEEVPVPAAAATTATAVENAAVHSLISQEIQKILKSEDYQILYWYYVEEDMVDPVTKAVIQWTDKEIGERLGMPLNTITARRTRALARLRRHHRLRQLFQDLLERDQPDEDATQ